MKHSLLTFLAPALLAWWPPSCSAQQPAPTASVARIAFTSVPIPTEMEFCGEKVPLDRADIRERLERELLSNTYRHAATILLIKEMGRWQPRINAVLQSEDAPEDLFYLACAESSLNPNAVSPSNAVGLWQFLEGTAKSLGLEITESIDERRHTEKATRAAVAYLRQGKQKFGSWTSAAAAYNRGPNGLARAMEAQLADSYYDLYLNEETSRYVFRILALKLILQNPSLYGFDIPRSERYEEYKTRPVSVNSNIPSLPSFARSQGTTYYMLRLLNPWLSGGVYSLILPRTRPSIELLLPQD